MTKEEFEQAVKIDNDINVLTTLSFELDKTTKIRFIASDVDTYQIELDQNSSDEEVIIMTKHFEKLKAAIANRIKTLEKQFAKL
jgi:DNA polymerase elongation subunit (family B)